MNNIRWDDLVFEKRNQAYGAYVLRKMYPNRVTMSFGVAMAVVVTLLASPTIKAMFGVDPVETIGKNIRDLDINHLSTPPVFPTPPPPRETPQVKQQRNVPPRVTEEEVTEVPPTIEELKTDISNQTTEGDVTYVESTAVVEPVVETVNPDKIWTIVEQAPEYIGGYQEMMKYIAKNTKYPSLPRRIGIEGSVFISFVVNVDGSIADVQTIKGIHADCDKEAMRVISKMPAWKPGKQNGKAVKVRFVVPIKFQLS
jgi:protein TonB